MAEAEIFEEWKDCTVRTKSCARGKECPTYHKTTAKNPEAKKFKVETVLRDELWCPLCSHVFCIPCKAGHDCANNKLLGKPGKHRFSQEYLEEAVSWQLDTVRAHVALSALIYCR